MTFLCHREIFRILSVISLLSSSLSHRNELLQTYRTFRTYKEHILATDNSRATQSTSFQLRYYLNDFIVLGSFLCFYYKFLFFFWIYLSLTSHASRRIDSENKISKRKK